MIIYSIASALSILFSCIRKRKTLSLFLSCFSLLLVAALRQFVGTDYAVYYYFKVPEVISNPIRLELGFSLLTYFSVVILGSYQWLIAGMACITCFCYWSSIFRYSKNVPLSLLIFISLGCYYFMLNGMRQSVAIAVFFFSIRFIEEKKLKKFLLCILFAFSFHSSALLYIPVYWLSRKHISNKWIVGVSFFLYIIYPLISSFVYPIILGKYAAYFGWGAKSGFNWRFLLPLLGMIFLDVRSKMESVVLREGRDSRLNIIRNLAIFSFWACNLAPTLTGASAMRVICFFLPAAAIYFPCVCNFKKVYRVSLAVLFAGIFFWTTNAGLGGILPYHSIFSDYKISYNQYLYMKYHSDDNTFKNNN